MNINDMPDDVLIRLLDTAAPGDVVRAKRLNKRFNALVETFNLGKPRVKDLHIESRVSDISPTKIGRLRLGAARHGIKKRRTVVTMRKDRGAKQFERVDDPSCSTQAANEFVQESLKKVVLGDRLSFDGLTLDEDFYKMITVKWNCLKNVTTLSMSLCHIRISWTEFADLLSRMTIKHLYIDFCTFDPSLISDKVLMALPHLESIQIQPRYPCFLTELTDQTLLHWTNREAGVPKLIQFRNVCASRMSLEGVKSLLSKAISTNAQKLDWDFGLLLEPARSDSVLLSFVLCPGWRTTVSDDFRSRRINLERQGTLLQFQLPAPIPAENLSAAAPVNV